MSLHGLHALMPPGMQPDKPWSHGVAILPAISCADESTFDAWLSLAPNDGRTLEEFAANPVLQIHSIEDRDTIVIGTSIPYATGFLKSSLRPPPPQNTTIKM